MYSLKRIRKLTHIPDSLFNIILSELAVYFTWFFANLTRFITPNIVSFLSFLFYLSGAWMLYKGSFIIGGLLIAIRNILDEVDGRLARLTDRTSKIGHLLDAAFNYIGTITVFVAIFLSGETMFIKLMFPFFVIMYFLYPLQNLTVRLLLKNTKRKRYQSLFCYKDTRIIVFIILPIFYELFLQRYNISDNIAIFLMAFFLMVSQFFWIIYFIKDFKERFNPKKSVDVADNL